MPTVMKSEQIDISSLVYSAPKINSIGGQTVFVNDASRNKIRVHTPKCYLPFGVSEYNDKFSLQMSLNSETDAMKNFKNFLENLDKNNIQQGVKNPNWWKKPTISEETVAELYNSSMKQNNPNYPPMFKAKLPFKNGEFDGNIYDDKRNLISFDKITKSCHVEAIVELTGIYFVQKEFGLSWKVVQLKVYPSEKMVGYSFLDDDDSEESDAEPI